MKYFKFNNSRSKKMPFFVYLKALGSTIKDVSDSSWAGVPHDAVSITEEEWNSVRESYLATGDVKENVKS